MTLRNFLEYLNGLNDEELNCDFEFVIKNVISKHPLYRFMDIKIIPKSFDIHNLDVFIPPHDFSDRAWIKNDFSDRAWIKNVNITLEGDESSISYSLD